jgi:hypothetical protein
MSAFVLFVLPMSERPCSGLIPRPSSPTDLAEDYETAKATRAQRSGAQRMNESINRL